jgi:hypothetical protein
MYHGCLNRMEQKSLQSVHYQQSYIEFYLCYAYVVNSVSLTPMAYLTLRDLRSVRHPSLVAVSMNEFIMSYDFGFHNVDYK